MANLKKQMLSAFKYNFVKWECNLQLSQLGKGFCNNNNSIVHSDNCLCKSNTPAFYSHVHNIANMSLPSLNNSCNSVSDFA